MTKDMKNQEVRKYEDNNYKFCKTEKDQYDSCQKCTFYLICQERENKALDILGNCSEEGREDGENGYFVVTEEPVTKPV